MKRRPVRNDRQRPVLDDDLDDVASRYDLVLFNGIDRNHLTRQQRSPGNATDGHRPLVDERRGALHVRRERPIDEHFLLDQIARVDRRDRHRIAHGLLRERATAHDGRNKGNGRDPSHDDRYGAHQSHRSTFDLIEDRTYRRPLEIVAAISSAAWITFEFIS